MTYDIQLQIAELSSKLSGARLAITEVQAQRSEARNALAKACDLLAETQRKLHTLIYAAQYVCQTVNGSDPEATKRAHNNALIRLMDALNEVHP